MLVVRVSGIDGSHVTGSSLSYVCVWMNVASVLVTDVSFSLVSCSHEFFVEFPWHLECIRALWN